MDELVKGVCQVSTESMNRYRALDEISCSFFFRTRIRMRDKEVREI